MSYEYNTEFSRVLQQQMDYFSNDPNADAITRMRGGMAEVKHIMIENIEKVKASIQSLLIVALCPNVCDAEVTLRCSELVPVLSQLRLHSRWCTGSHLLFRLCLLYSVHTISFLIGIFGVGCCDYEWDCECSGVDYTPFSS